MGWASVRQPDERAFISTFCAFVHHGTMTVTARLRYLEGFRGAVVRAGNVATGVGRMWGSLQRPVRLRFHARRKGKGPTQKRHAHHRAVRDTIFLRAIHRRSVHGASRRRALRQAISIVLARRLTRILTGVTSLLGCRVASRNDDSDRFITAYAVGDLYERVPLSRPSVDATCRAASPPAAKKCA
ncbi:hypothetical protein SAMN05192544_108021 [Paraburkholderia hospita]|nr:hypothetical protein SAMN05192544_108021 [Paraburkholderia hospita]